MVGWAGWEESSDDAWRRRRLNEDRDDQPTKRRLLLVWSRTIRAAEARRQTDWKRFMAFILVGKVGRRFQTLDELVLIDFT